MIRLYAMLYNMILYTIDICCAAQHEKRTKILTKTPQLNFALHNLIRPDVLKYKL